MRACSWRVGLWLSLFLLVAAVPATSETRTLTQPDPRAIPLLMSQSGNLRRYGTGVVVGPNIILTAQHVLAQSIQVVFPRTPVAGRPACRTRYEGLALVQAALPSGTPFYRLSFRTPLVGEKVTVAGYPLRKWRVVSARVTSIIHSATLSGRVVRTPMIVFKPALDYGASGAPLLDGRGQVIGITVASNGTSNYSIAFPTATGLSTCRGFVH